ncbi:Phosphotransferase system lactose/cellobiose-specific IIB subunit [Tepidanaerobacter acetatoxydans Re1]|uniref:Phosphotransferase system lactose/cellobiose-specific IIB subunit n=1 Tax=Tepidanaerobacter acetatoxydans (strain DSM 21804 / JCM 16047 / Re1) TaxID=1209989 RepID=F4LRK1_TEPAE|nr:PTS sugar transporter subunit IIB [Tepidanaerobacter acetatoxydans]AEE90264.1 phosphotransferase system lactose/cellobiose-specific IIB subunit [Tepidanaerobacter acetatoxydans Re1]CDI40267.1 Phosphotransferase system lactose/cellobiose-specific IIB subunit [Tepidanaerobacter acetatoxydans Re1]
MKILIVCNAGMSTGIMQIKLQKCIESDGQKASVEAIPLTEIEQNLEGTDIILLGPQVRFAEDEIKRMTKNSIPVFSIDIQDFGLMRAENVWQQIKKELSKK